MPGGLAVSTVFATAGFAAVSGASVATAAVFARIAIPEMLKIGYNKQFAAGVVAAGGTLASLIPPSAILVIYAIIVEQDVGKLLLAGFIPGAFSAIVYAVLIIGIAVIFKSVRAAGLRLHLARALRLAAARAAHRRRRRDHHLLRLQPVRRRLGHTDRRRCGGRLHRLRHGALAGDALEGVEIGAAGNGKAHRDDLHDHLGRADLCPLSGLRASCPRAFADWITVAGDGADPDPDLHPAGLRCARHVHGRDRDAAPDAARGLSGRHGAQRGRDGLGRRQRLRHVGDRCARSGSVSWW